MLAIQNRSIMITIKNLSKSFGVGSSKQVVLKNINLNIKKGEIFGIIGKSGAGKSTLIRCVNRLETPNQGDILVNNMNVTQMNNSELRLARRQMGMVFQHFNLMTRYTIYENISLPLKFEGLSHGATQERINHLLDLTELQDHRNKIPSQLSGGQKQRVAIARALASSPKVILSDEATSALDPSSTQSILKLLRSINEELGITIMLITHEMNVVKNVCDRVAVIDKGSIIESGNVLDLFTKPKTDIAKDFVATTSNVTLPPAVKQRLHPTATANSSLLIKISYHGDSASQPILGFLIQKYRITVNMLLGNIETIHGETVGTMVVEIKGDKQDLTESIEFLERNQLNVDILGHLHD